MSRRVVCAHCGLRLILWCGKTWKHLANQYVQSCRKPARPVWEKCL